MGYMKKKVHKLVQNPNRFNSIGTECKMENKTYAFVVSHHWRHTDCERCLARRKTSDTCKDADAKPS